MNITCQKHVKIAESIKIDALVKSIQRAKIKVPYTRRSDFSDKKSYMQYFEWLKNCYNAVDGTFYDAIKIRIKNIHGRDTDHPQETSMKPGVIIAQPEPRTEAR